MFDFKKGITDCGLTCAITWEKILKSYQKAFPPKDPKLGEVTMVKGIKCVHFRLDKADAEGIFGSEYLPIMSTPCFGKSFNIGTAHLRLLASIFTIMRWQHVHNFSAAPSV